MKLSFAVWWAIASTHAEPGLAGPSKVSPLIGSWSVDVTRLPIPPEARPKSVTITFSEVGGDKWTTQVDIVDGGGVATHCIGTAALDGSPAPVKDCPETDTAAMTLPVPNVLVMDLAKGGVGGSARVYSVAADGKSMVETAAYFAQDGRPIMRTNYFKRVR